MQGPQILSGDRFLLTTLLVKLAVVAALATMLVRYRRFRHILIFERRAWPDRLIFALSLGIPLTAGVGVARLLLNYNAADLTLEGSFLAGLIAGPYAGAVVGTMVGLPPLGNGEWAALPFAVGCGFAGGGLRELCPKESIWHFSPFVFTGLHRRAWQMMRTMQVDWQVVLLLAPVALELLRQGLGSRWSDHHRLFYLHGAPPSSPWMMVWVLLATVLGVATPIKIWNNARIEHRLQEQEKLLLAAKIEALANQISPHFLFNTLASISSLIRTQPETARMLIIKLSGLLRRLMRSTDHFVTLRAVLVDDEPLARDELGYLLGQVGGVEVIGQAGNGVEALTTIDRLQPDVVFLDVQMPGLTGFEVARRMLDQQASSHIIFVTAYDQHAIEAFEVNAVDYLLKPVDPSRLQLAVQRARRRIQFDRPDRSGSAATAGPPGTGGMPGMPG